MVQWVCIHFLDSGNPVSLYFFSCFCQCASSVGRHTCQGFNRTTTTMLEKWGEIFWVLHCLLFSRISCIFYLNLNCWKCSFCLVWSRLSLSSLHSPHVCYSPHVWRPYVKFRLQACFIYIVKVISLPNCFIHNFSEPHFFLSFLNIKNLLHFCSRCVF